MAVVVKTRKHQPSQEAFTSMTIQKVQVEDSEVQVELKVRWPGGRQNDLENL